MTLGGDPGILGCANVPMGSWSKCPQGVSQVTPMGESMDESLGGGFRSFGLFHVPMGRFQCPQGGDPVALGWPSVPRGVPEVPPPILGCPSVPRGESHMSLWVNPSDFSGESSKFWRSHVPKYGFSVSPGVSPRCHFPISGSPQIPGGSQVSPGVSPWTSPSNFRNFGICQCPHGEIPGFLQDLSFQHLEPWLHWSAKRLPQTGIRKLGGKFCFQWKRTTVRVQGPVARTWLLPAKIPYGTGFIPDPNTTI